MKPKDGAWLGGRVWKCTQEGKLGGSLGIARDLLDFFFFFFSFFSEKVRKLPWVCLPAHNPEGVGYNRKRSGLLFVRSKPGKQKGEKMC